MNSLRCVKTETCCFCIPLNIGVILIAANDILNMIIIVPINFSSVDYESMKRAVDELTCSVSDGSINALIGLTIIFVIIKIIEGSFAILFLVGMKLKRIKLCLIYMYSKMLMAVFYAVACIIFLALIISESCDSFVFFCIVGFSQQLLFIILALYFSCVLNSYIEKLKS